MNSEYGMISVTVDSTVGRNPYKVTQLRIADDDDNAGQIGIILPDVLKRCVSIQECISVLANSLWYFLENYHCDDDLQELGDKMEAAVKEFCVNERKINP